MNDKKSYYARVLGLIVLIAGMLLAAVSYGDYSTQGDIGVLLSLFLLCLGPAIIIFGGDTE